MYTYVHDHVSLRIGSQSCVVILSNIVANHLTRWLIRRNVCAAKVSTMSGAAGEAAEAYVMAQCLLRIALMLFL